jgi:hypothetical protein
LSSLTDLYAQFGLPPVSAMAAFGALALPCCAWANFRSIWAIRSFRCWSSLDARSSRRFVSREGMVSGALAAASWRSSQSFASGSPCSARTIARGRNALRSVDSGVRYGRGCVFDGIVRPCFVCSDARAASVARSSRLRIRGVMLSPTLFAVVRHNFADAAIVFRCWFHTASAFASPVGFAASCSASRDS